MPMLPERDDRGADDVRRTILWPLVYAPLLFILVIHVGTRIGWFLGWR